MQACPGRSCAHVLLLVEVDGSPRGGILFLMKSRRYCWLSITTMRPAPLKSALCAARMPTAGRQASPQAPVADKHDPPSSYLCMSWSVGSHLDHSPRWPPCAQGKTPLRPALADFPGTACTGCSLSQEHRSSRNKPQLSLACTRKKNAMQPGSWAKQRLRLLASLERAYRTQCAHAEWIQGVQTCRPCPHRPLWPACQPVGMMSDRKMTFSSDR